MNLNYMRTGFSLGALVFAACSPSVIDPIGGAPGSGGSGGGSAGEAGRPSEGGAGDGGAGRANQGGAGNAGTPGGDGGQKDVEAGSGGTAGVADCSEALSAAENAIENNRACTQDSDCELIRSGCLFAGRESCGNQYAFSKAAHAQVTAAYTEYEACAGECKKGNACDPEHIAQCSHGQCSDHPSDCDNVAADITAAIEGQHACSLSVRVDSVSLAILGHVLDCGPTNIVDEAGARASADAAAPPDPGFGQPLGAGDLLSGPSPNDVWLFKQLFGDFGHVSAVSPKTGRTLFWAQLGWSGDPFHPTLAGSRTGAAQAPVAWSTSEIGTSCYVSPALTDPRITQRDWDVRADATSGPVAPPEVVAAHVLTSAAVHRISLRLPLINVVTIHYGVSAVVTAPVSEYVVIVNGFEPIAF